MSGQRDRQTHTSETTEGRWNVALLLLTLLHPVKERGNKGKGCSLNVQFIEKVLQVANTSVTHSLSLSIQLKFT